MRKPNILYILTDDHGYGDLGCMGARDLRTPHLDALAAEGCLFQAMYAGAPSSSPSRASLLTGRYPANAGVRADLPGDRGAPGLTPEAPTIAAALRREGYRTALIGKWHLGLRSGCRPRDNGFDEFRGFLSGSVDCFSHIHYWNIADGQPSPIHDLWEDETEVWENGTYLTHYITDRTIDFIRRSATEPFFACAAYNAPHYPMHAPRAYVERFSHLPAERRMFAALLDAVDEGVGAILAALRECGLEENTLVYFQSICGPSREAKCRLDGSTPPSAAARAARSPATGTASSRAASACPRSCASPGASPAGGGSPSPARQWICFRPSCAPRAGIPPRGNSTERI